MWDKIWKFLTDNKDALDFLFGSGAVLAVLGGLFTFGRWLLKEYRLRRIRTNDNFPFKIIPPNSNVAKEILGGTDDDPLADRNIPYQQRIQGRNTRREFEELIENHRWILITGRTGLGKTREAVQLAQSLNSEGWTILFLTREAWLDAPAKLPSNVPERKLLFFLDDLNKKCFSSKAEIRPNAKESLTLPIYEAFQTRLQRTLEAFDTFCGKSEIRVIATARNEKISEFDEPPEWDKLNWAKHNDLWEKFKIIDLPEPDETAEEKLLAETASKADVHINSDDLPSIASRNDGTFRNLVENLSSARAEKTELSLDNFRETLKGTWHRRYQKAILTFSEARHIYDSIDLIQAVDLQISFPAVLQVAQLISNKSILQRALSYTRYSSTLKHLVKNENILHPRDGQIESKGYKIKVENYLFKLYIQIAKDYYSKEKTLIKFLNITFGVLLIPQTYILDEKLPPYKKILSTFFSAGSALNNIGNAYIRRGFPNQAISLYRRSIELKKWDPLYFLLGLLFPIYKIATLIGLGNTYTMLQMYEEALDAFNKAANINPKSEHPWNGIGTLYFETGNFDDAHNAFQMAIKLNPRSSMCWGNLGILLLANQRIEEAVQAFMSSIEADPNYSYSILSLALSHKKLGNLTESDRFFCLVESRIESEGEYVKACYYSAKGEIKEGIVHLKNGLKNADASRGWARKDPNFESLRNDPLFKELVGLS